MLANINSLLDRVIPIAGGAFGQIDDVVIASEGRGGNPNLSAPIDDGDAPATVLFVCAKVA